MARSPPSALPARSSALHRCASGRRRRNCGRTGSGRPGRRRTARGARTLVGRRGHPGCHRPGSRRCCSPPQLGRWAQAAFLNAVASVRTLAAPTQREIEALAEIFDQYRAHYGEDPDASRSACWLDENLSGSRLRVFVAEESGDSSALRARWKCRPHCGSRISGRSETSLSCRHTNGIGVGRALLASIRAAAIASGALRPPTAATP
jgi:hypothetical protein